MREITADLWENRKGLQTSAPAQSLRGDLLPGALTPRPAALRKSPHLDSLAAALGKASVAWCSPILLQRLVTALPRV
jgi:hypothetical protein